MPKVVQIIDSRCHLWHYTCPLGSRKGRRQNQIIRQRREPGEDWRQVRADIPSQASKIKTITSKAESGATQVAKKSEFIGRPEVAELLGISERSVHRMTMVGEIPSYRIGHLRRYRASEVIRAIEGSRVASTAEVLR